MSTRTRAYLLSLLIVLLLPAASPAATARIITKENTIREECRFFANPVIRVNYADTLEIISQDGDWYRVKYNDMEGCIHKSAVEEKKFRLSNIGSSRSGASADEVALAGKGFNPQVEESFKGRHPELDFGAVDRIESYGVEERELKTFIEDGELNQP